MTLFVWVGEIVSEFKYYLSIIHSSIIIALLVILKCTLHFAAFISVFYQNDTYCPYCLALFQCQEILQWVEMLNISSFFNDVCTFKVSGFQLFFQKESWSFQAFWMLINFYKYNLKKFYLNSVFFYLFKQKAWEENRTNYFINNCSRKGEKIRRIAW